MVHQYAAEPGGCDRDLAVARQLLLTGQSAPGRSAATNLLAVVIAP